MNKTPVLAITLGDQAGSSPEIAVKVILNKAEDYIPVFIGNKAQLLSILPVVEGSDKLQIIDWDGAARPEKKDGCYVYFYNIDVEEGGIQRSTITAASGKLIFNMLKTGVDMQNDKRIDGFLMAPITKAALHEAGYDFTSEFEVYDYLYNTEGCASVIRCDPYFRSTVVGHCSFREIADKITIDSVKNTTYRLARIMKYFLENGKRCRIGVAALNPHAGENGLFGTEEITILTPAIEQLNAEGYDVVGPWPADTAINRVHAGDSEGIVYLFHDQGNIAQKACEFGGLVLIYVNIPGNIVSVGHGPAYDLAGTGKANADNMILSMSSLYKIVVQKLAEEC